MNGDGEDREKKSLLSQDEEYFTLGSDGNRDEMASSTGRPSSGDYLKLSSPSEHARLQLRVFYASK